MRAITEAIMGYYSEVHPIPATIGTTLMLTGGAASLRASL